MYLLSLMYMYPPFSLPASPPPFPLSPSLTHVLAPPFSFFYVTAQATLIRDVPYAAMSFFIFENLRSMLSKKATDGAVRYSCVAVRCSVLQHVVLCCSVLQCDYLRSNVFQKQTR